MAPRPWSREDYVRFFEAFLAGPGAELSKTRFGYFAVGEPSFFKNLERGTRKMRLETIERAVEFVKKYKAENERKTKSDNRIEGDAGA